MKHTWLTIWVVIVLFSIQSSLFVNLTSPTEIEQNTKINKFTEQYKHDWNVQNYTIDSVNKNIFSLKESGYANNNNAIVQLNERKKGPMESIWPMLSYDVHHAGRSPLSTINNLGAELWRFQSEEAGVVWSSPVINREGTIYFGTLGDGSLYSLNPNGTENWRYRSYGTALVWSTPALADDGTIYFGTWGSYPYFRALNPNGTEKWLFATGPANSPTIADDGIIYVGSDNSNIWALDPNGTLRWTYDTGGVVMGCPAIGDDGTIYIGSGDHYLYALYPNGTLRWRYATGSEIKGSASIAPDGTIYIPSFDGYLYALNPNGTMQWRASTGGSVAGAGVALADDGTIYIGTERLRAYYPNGTLKWVTDAQGSIYSTVPAVSADGTIYVSAGGSLVAVNPDGTEKWRKQLTIAQIHSSPIVGPDDCVYVGSEDYGDLAYGYLHAFGVGPLRAEAYGSYNGAMTEPLQFTGGAFGGTPPYTAYHWDFGDGANSDEQNPTHTYAHRGNYTATFTIIDTIGNHSSDTTLVTIGYPLPQISLLKPTNAVYIFNIKILPWPYPLVFGKIMFQIEATQVEIEIDRVDFYYDGQLMQTDETAPYQYLYTGHAPPLHQTFMIRAYDTRGNSNTITETINKWF
jgi:outer membrane protein assembly factor BamB